MVSKLHEQVTHKARSLVLDVVMPPIKVPAGRYAAVITHLGLKFPWLENKMRETRRVAEERMTFLQS